MLAAKPVGSTSAYACAAASKRDVYATHPACNREGGAPRPVAPRQQPAPTAKHRAGSVTTAQSTFAARSRGPVGTAPSTAACRRVKQATGQGAEGRRHFTLPEAGPRDGFRSARREDAHAGSKCPADRPVAQLHRTGEQKRERAVKSRPWGPSVNTYGDNESGGLLFLRRGVLGP